MALSDIAGPRISSIKKQIRRKKKVEWPTVTHHVVEKDKDVEEVMRPYFQGVFEKHHPGCDMYDDDYGEDDYVGSFG